MTTRGQILRSSVTGNIPAPATRAAGELWANFADKQLGVIDASRTAQKLLAVRYFATTAAYVAGDVVVQAGELYIAKASVPAGAFNSTQWNQVAWISDILAPYVLPTASTTTLGGVKIDGSTININGAGVISSAGLVTVQSTAPSPVQNGALWFDLVGGQLYVWANDGSSSQWVVAVNQSLGGVYLPMTGGVLTGPLTLAADPVNPLDAVTKQYSDAHGAINDNRVINGDMRIDQRNNGASGTAIGYTVDRWCYNATQLAKFGWQRAPAPGFEFPYYLGVSVQSAYTPLTGDTFTLFQAIEADMISDFMWGTAAAKPVTLSFYVTSSLGGTFSGCLKGATRSYPFTFPIIAAQGLTKVVVTIPGDTAGTWTLQGNGLGLTVLFDLGTGATYRGPAGAWSGTIYNGVTGTVSVVATAGATFAVTGVKLEIGSVATPYNRQSLAKSMADCQRYYQTVQGGFSFYAGAVAGFSTFCFLGTAMRAVPTVAVGSTVGADANVASGPTVDVLSQSGFRFSISTLAAGATQALRNLTASAEL